MWTWIFWIWAISVPVLAGFNWGFWVKKTNDFNVRNVVTLRPFFSRSVAIATLFGGVITLAVFLFIEFFNFCAYYIEDDKEKD